MSLACFCEFRPHELKIRASKNNAGMGFERKGIISASHAEHWSGGESAPRGNTDKMTEMCRSPQGEISQGASRRAEAHDMRPAALV